MHPEQLPHADETFIVPESFLGADSIRAARSTIPNDLPLPQIPGYIVEALIGRGSMGMVYRARQIRVANRQVAIKMIRFDREVPSDVITRFQREIEIIGTLQHPNIVSIYESGIVGDAHYFVMEYILGETLDAQFARSPLSGERAAQLIRVLACAMEYAHSQGVVHRDLKPGNIMLTEDGAIKILDFGLARIARDDKSVTHTGGILGTPHYMSPEQASGKLDLVGPVSDVYSLGAILYRAITGVLPFDTGTAFGTIDLVVRKEPVAPRKLQPSISRDLETVCLKCMEKDSAKRYVSAQALADDLERFLEQMPIFARPVGRPERLYRWARRKPAIAALSLCVILACCTLATLFAVRRYEAMQGEIHRIVQAQRLAEEETKRRQAEGKIFEANYDKLLIEVSQAVRTDVSRAQDLLHTAPKEFLASWEGAYFSKLCRNELATYEGHTGPVWNVAVSPSGKLLASVGSGKNTFCVWNTDDGSIVRQWTGRETGDARCVVFLSDNRVAVGASTGDVRIFSPSTDDTQILSVNEELLCLAVSNDRRFIMAGSVTGTIAMWDVISLERVTTYAHGSPVTTLACTPDEQRFISGGGEHVKVWDVKSEECVGTLTHTGTVRSAVVHPDGVRVFSGEDTGKITAWDIQKGEMLFSCTGHEGAALSLCTTPDGTSIISGGRDGKIRVWNAMTGEAQGALVGHRDAITAIASGLPGSLIVSASRDRTVRIWDVSSSGEYQILQGHTGKATCIAAHPTLPLVASGSGDGAVIVWNEKQEQVRRFTHESPVTSALFMPNGEHLVSGTDHGTVTYWEVGSGEKIATWMQSALVRSIAVHSDGSRLLSTGNDGIRMWSIGSKASPASFVSTVKIGPACFLPSGSIVFGRDDGTVCRWSGIHGEKPAVLYAHSGPVQAIAVFDDHVFSGATDGVQAWEMSANTAAEEFRTDAVFTTALAVTHNGTRIFAGGLHGPIRVLDAHHGKELFSLPNTKGTTSIAVFKDGNVFFAGQDSTVRGVIVAR